MCPLGQEREQQTSRREALLSDKERESESLAQQLQQKESELESEQREKDALAQEVHRRETQLRTQVETQQQELRQLVKPFNFCV